MIIDLDKSTSDEFDPRNTDNKDKFQALMQEIFDINAKPYHLKAADVLKHESGTWLVLALAQADHMNIAAYAQQLVYFEKILRSHELDVKLVDGRPMGQCSCCKSAQGNYEELVGCLLTRN